MPKRKTEFVIFLDDKPTGCKYIFKKEAIAIANLMWEYGHIVDIYARRSKTPRRTVWIKGSDGDTWNKRWMR